MRPKVAVLPGDGIGPEVIAAALDRFGTEWDVTMLDAGSDRYLSTGEILTGADLDVCRASHAILFGAVGDPRVEDGVLERGILLRLRTELDLYVNLRPFPELDLVIVRENTEGLYAGIGGRSEDGAFEMSVNTRGAVSRCARYAFELAADRSQHLTLVHKTNVLGYAGGLWSDVVAAEARLHPQVNVSYEHVDAAAYHLVKDPSRFDVILTDNLFGDILSDLAAGLAGGLGAAAGANLHPDAATRPSRCIGLFEPIHGSAPDIAGTGSADPTAASRAAEMLCAALEPELEGAKA
jgi:3-isopropylmalate dehydrogenase